ncbi:MAG: hypothetical protein JJU00_06535 [Opitutales bacterium]|nr:hypothetical protein [Opitutales bacterium]
MPNAKDITGDLYRLHNRKPKKASPPPLRGRALSRRRARKQHEEAAAPTRRMRFEPFTYFAWTATVAFILGQGLLIYWLAQ